MKKFSKLTVAVAACASALALALPGAASADPKPCHKDATLLSTTLVDLYALADQNGNGYICLGPDKRSGLLTDVSDDKVH